MNGGMINTESKAISIWSYVEVNKFKKELNLKYQDRPFSRHPMIEKKDKFLINKKHMFDNQLQEIMSILDICSPMKRKKCNGFNKNLFTPNITLIWSLTMSLPQVYSFLKRAQKKILKNYLMMKNMLLSKRKRRRNNKQCKRSRNRSIQRKKYPMFLKKMSLKIKSSLMKNKIFLKHLYNINWSKATSRSIQEKFWENNLNPTTKNQSFYTSQI